MTVTFGSYPNSPYWDSNYGDDYNDRCLPVPHTGPRYYVMEDTNVGGPNEVSSNIYDRGTVDTDGLTYVTHAYGRDIKEMRENTQIVLDAMDTLTNYR